ncbi:hypothetical protein CIG19_20500 [Enterobacterales bacterium CwR94]|nr:hypothetical protein CIG19_20500 [Enterobacterales bacterium CwR94]
MKKMLLLLTLSLLTGWFISPVIYGALSGNCTSDSTLIYDEPDRTVISKARWEQLRGGEQYYYSSTLHIIPFRGQETEFAVERTLVTSLDYALDSLDVKTVNASRIAGPASSDPDYGRYIDPLAEEGFHARVYLFYTGDRLLTGFRNAPVSVCQK